MKNLLRVGAVLGFLGVVMGAFGAHGWKGLLLERGTLQVWQTAVFYHLLHAVAIVAMAGRVSAGVVWTWLGGVVLFSGPLYLLAATGPRWMGAVTPVGGILLVSGWLWLAVTGGVGGRRD